MADDGLHETLTIMIRRMHECTTDVVTFIEREGITLTDGQYTSLGEIGRMISRLQHARAAEECAEMDMIPQVAMQSLVSTVSIAPRRWTTRRSHCAEIIKHGYNPKDDEVTRRVTLVDVIKAIGFNVTYRSLAGLQAHTRDKDDVQRISDDKFYLGRNRALLNKLQT